MTLFSGYIIAQARSLTSYLEQRPYDGAWTWLAGSPCFATVLDRVTAQELAQGLTEAGEQVEVLPDPFDRVPQRLAPPAVRELRRGAA